MTSRTLPARWLPAAFLVLLAFLPLPALPQEAARPSDAAAAETRAEHDFGKLLDAVVAATVKSFWDKERLAEIGWEKRAAEVRQGIVEAPNLEEAARRINALLGELKTSHTVLLTPDEVDYYVLLAVFNGAGMPQQDFDARFWGTGITYAGIGHFSVRIDGRDFVDAVLEGSPADRAGLKVGDEIVSIDGAAYHPIRSFRGKVGNRAAVTIRRADGGPTETLQVPVMAIAPLHAFREATRASARVIERDGARVGYIHVWHSVGDEAVNAFDGALARLGINQWPDARDRKTPPVPLEGLIVDMRGRIGGTAHVAKRYLDSIEPRGPLLGSRNKSRPSTSVRGRTAVLIDHHTRSTAELFVHAYKRERHGPLIGTRTAGAVSGGGAFLMPGNNLLYLAISGLEIDGEVLEGPGVAPDLEVARPIPFSAGADPVLDAAVDHFARRAKGRRDAEPQSKGTSQ
jgi:carboxyl-terminal processing protease